MYEHRSIGYVLDLHNSRGRLGGLVLVEERVVAERSTRISRVRQPLDLSKVYNVDEAARSLALSHIAFFIASC